MAEYHRQVAPSPGLPDPAHYDQDSLVTFDVLLNDPEDFDGGLFQTLEKDGKLQPHPVQARGDALLFVSHKYHCVTPVTRGERHVLVVEFWRHPKRTCGHRCEVVGAVRCPREPLSSHPALASEKIPSQFSAQFSAGSPQHPKMFFPQLPMRLGNVSAPDDGIVRVLWQEHKQVTAPKPPVQLAARTDEIWDLFD